MPSNTAARGLRRAELVSSDPLSSATFHEALLGWRALQSESGFDCWVGERRCASIRGPRAGEHDGWRIVFAGAAQDSSLSGPDDTGAAIAKGRAQHGPWAPAPRQGEPCWVDLFAREAQRADAFWAETFHWTLTQDVSEETAAYTCAGRPVAARTCTPRPDGRWGWLCYYAVDNVDLAGNRVHELGGTIIEWVQHPVISEAVIIADPHGAVYALAPHTKSWGMPAVQSVS